MNAKESIGRITNELFLPTERTVSHTALRHSQHISSHNASKGHVFTHQSSPHVHSPLPQWDNEHSQSTRNQDRVDCRRRWPTEMVSLTQCSSSAVNHDSDSTDHLAVPTYGPERPPGVVGLSDRSGPTHTKSQYRPISLSDAKTGVSLATHANFSLLSVVNPSS